MSETSRLHSKLNTYRLQHLLRTVLPLVLLINLPLLANYSESNSQETEKDIAVQAFPGPVDPKLEKLIELVIEAREMKEKRGSLTGYLYDKIRRLSRGRSEQELELLRRILRGESQITIPDEPGTAVEEVRVVWRPFEFVPEDPDEFSIVDIRKMRGIRGTANSLYRQGEYSKAYPLLLNLAKRGFKDSQSRLAYVLFNGADGIEKSNLRAMGWLGAAAHGRTEPGFKVLFNKYNRQVPEEFRPLVDQVVSQYQERFSYPEHMDCTTNHRYSSGVIKSTYCRFKLEAIADAQGSFVSWVDKVNVRDDEDRQSR